MTEFLPARFMDFVNALGGEPWIDANGVRTLDHARLTAMWNDWRA